MANEVWISARRNNSWLEKWYPILDSKAASSARMNRSRYFAVALAAMALALMPLAAD